MSRPTAVEERARLHAALGDPARLTIVDELSVSDRSPTELGQLTGLDSNLLAHHLAVLESVGLIGRSRSSGDGRRRYVRLHHERLVNLGAGRAVQPAPALFVCTANSARSQLASALWRHLTGLPATSAGTHPADRVHPGAVAAARRAGLDLADSRPQSLDEVAPPALVVTVCDRAHEELPPDPRWLHWSVPDPVPVGTARAFDRTVGELRARMHRLLDRRVA
jgi:protein-tyrosine-phosphatase